MYIYIYICMYVYIYVSAYQSNRRTGYISRVIAYLPVRCLPVRGPRDPTWTKATTGYNGCYKLL